MPEREKKHSSLEGWEAAESCCEHERRIWRERGGDEKVAVGAREARRRVVEREAVERCCRSSSAASGV